MKHHIKRLSALLLAVILSFSLALPGLAADPNLSESRTENAVRFNPAFKFYDRWSVPGATGFEWFTVPFDSASGMVMFCVDPGVNASSNPKNYEVFLGTGDSRLDEIMALAEKTSKLRNLKNANNKNDAADPEWGITSEILEEIGPDKMDRIVKAISVLHYHAGEGIYGPPTAGEAYNLYDVYAVQCMIWNLCNPNSPGLWFPLGGLGEAEANKVKTAYSKIIAEAKRLYGTTVSSFKLESGQYSKDNQTVSEQKVLSLGTDGVKDYAIDEKSKNDWALIKYVTLDGTTVQAFTAGSSVSTGSFTITNTGNGFHVEVADEEDTGIYTVRFLTTDIIPDDTKAAGEDWAVYAQAGSRYQSYFSAYKAPQSANLFLSFARKADPEMPNPVFPQFAFEQVKLDSVGGSDGNISTPIGDTGLDASFTVDWRTDMGEAGTEDSMADLFGQGASATIAPWNYENQDSTIVATKTEETALWPEEVEEPAEGEDPVEQEEYTRAITWEARCTVTVTETGVPEGRDGTNTRYTHTIVYRAYTERNSPEESWPEYTYTITVDGRDTGIYTKEDVDATWDVPYDVTQATGQADEFVNRGWVGVMQIIKTKDSDDIFSLEHGEGTVAGGAGAGKEYSTNSRWTVQLVSGGLEGQPYIKVVEDPTMQATPIGQLMHCYKVMLDGSGTPADEDHPLIPSDKGQIYISNLPYGTYLVTEHKADADRYVLESYLVTIGQDGQVVSTTVNNRAKRNVVTLVKVDSETGKRVPSAHTAFRIRYLGSPEYADPTQTPGYGKYLPNASSITAEIAGADDYIFYTDGSGACTIPYELPYGNYRLEELVVPDGYYIGKYDQTGQGSTVDGASNAAFENRVSIYDPEGNRVDYTAEAGMIFNYYSFAVTEQNAHLDGKGYELHELTVELSNTAAKGRVEVTKLGEKLAGFRAGTDALGRIIYEPVWQKVSVSGVTFGIYAARDILLKDGEEPPTAYDSLTGAPISMTTEQISPGGAVAAEFIRRGVHVGSGAEILTTIERSTENGGEQNQATTDYLTPTRRGTTYTARFSRYDADAGLTYEYEITFGLEYTAGGWNYSDVEVVRTILADDYMAELPADLPVVESGGQIVDYEFDTELANGNLLEVLANAIDDGLYLYNEYDTTGNDYQLQAAGTSDLSQVLPEIPENEREARLLDLPALPAGYAIQSIRAGFVTIGNGTVGQEMVAVYRPDEEASAEAGEPVRSVQWVAVADLGALAGFDPQADYYIPRYDLTGLTVKGVGGAPLDFAAYGYNDVRLAYATGSTVYVTLGEDPTLYGVYYTGSQGLDGSITAIDELKLILADEDVSLGGYDGPDPEGYPLPAGYEFIKDAFGYFAAYNEAEDAYMVFVKEADGTYRWIHCGADYAAYKVRRQAVHLKLTQPAGVPDGWKVSLDGVVFENTADGNTSTARAVITLPYATQPDVTEAVGYKVSTAALPDVGTETTVDMSVPEAPVYFEMVDGTRVELTYQGGYTKTTIKVPEGNSLPTITFDGAEVDYFDRANGGLTPTHSSYEIMPGGKDHYIRTARHEAVNGSKAWYSIELVSNAADEAGAHFEIQYRGSYRSVSLVTPDADTGTMRGLLRFHSLYRTMRYAQGDLVEQLTTGADGKAVSSLLPLGDYEVRELSVPNGLVASAESLPFSLTYKDQYTPLVWADVAASNDAVQVQLDLLKGFQKEQNGTEYVPGAGAVFGIYANETIQAETGYVGAGTVENSIPEGTLVALITTGTDGKAIETVKLPRGDYYVQELDAGSDRYQVNTDRYLFRAEDQQAGALNFKWITAGLLAKVTHTGYKTAEVQITTLPQLPMPALIVNGVTYDPAAALAAGTAGELCTVSNDVAGGRSVFTVTGTADGPLVIELVNGAKLTVEIGETGYTATFSGTAADTDMGAGITESTGENGGKVYRYEATVAQTGYTATTTAPYIAPRTVLTAENGTTLRFEYDLESGVRKAVIGWPEGWKYYRDEDLPLKDVAYHLGDLNKDGQVDGADIAILESALAGTAELTEHQKLLADLDRNGAVTEADLTALREAVAQGTVTDEITVKEPYLPADAILFETAGFGNLAYEYAVVDSKARTVTVDLSKVTTPVTVIVGEAVATLGSDTVTLTGGTVTASNGTTGEVVGDGLQADGLTLAGNTLTSSGRTLSLSAAGESSRTELEVDYNHTSLVVKTAVGAAVSVVRNGTALDNAAVAAGVLVALGDNVIVKYADGTTHRVDLSRNGSVELSVEGIKAGIITGTEGPRLWVNGSEAGFLDKDRLPITQEAVMDATSLDGIRQHNSQSVTLSRSDGFTLLYQIKLNAAGGQAQTIKNDLKSYISKVDATTGKELPGARIEIYDRTGAVIAAGVSDSEGKFWFKKPGPGQYTFREVTAPAGYELNEEIFSFTVNADGTITGDNTIKDEPERDTPDIPTPVPVEASVRKVWQAEEGAPRPRSVTAELLLNGTVYDTVTLSEENGWRYVWTGLRAGNWTVREGSVPAGYSSAVTRSGNDFVITNTYTAPKTVEVSARKVWVDDEAAQRPEHIIVELLLDDVVQDVATLSPANDWSCTWTDLPEGNWTVREREVPEGYTAAVSQDGLNFTITNTRIPEDVTVPVTVRKIWKGDEAAQRPEEITVELLLDGKVYSTVTLSAATGWIHTWLELPVGNWTVREQTVAGYTSEVRQDGTDFTITNTHIPETGDSTGWWLLTAAASAAALAWLALRGRKRGDGEA